MTPHWGIDIDDQVCFTKLYRKMMRTVLFLIFALSMGMEVHGQQLVGGGEANPHLKTNQKSLAQFLDMRFGMFIHWGPVSLRGTEIGWSRGREVPFEEYDHLYEEFNPALFDAAEWVRDLKNAGMKYIIFVSKHHDGFVMWDSETTDYNIMSTPFKRDILMEISKECERQGVLFGTYYSVCDWRHPDYPVEHKRGARENADMEAYIVYMKAQLRELVEKYKTRILWFDGEWEKPWTHEMGQDLYRYLREMDDELLINNRVDKGRAGMEGVSKSPRFAGDFATPEQKIGAFDTKTPWESCITICKQWAWKPNDQLKSEEECIHTLIRTVGGDGNLLLNIGPMLDGRFEKRQKDRLAEIGDWLEIYGETIYETRGGPIEPDHWGVSTSKGNKIYLHVLDEEVEDLIIEDFDYDLISAKMFHSEDELTYTLKDNKLSLQVPADPKPVIDRIVVLETAQP
jgi:alpha-L-fucosidase